MNGRPDLFNGVQLENYNDDTPPAEAPELLASHEKVGLVDYGNEVEKLEIDVQFQV